MVDVSVLLRCSRLLSGGRWRVMVPAAAALVGVAWASWCRAPSVMAPALLVIALAVSCASARRRVRRGGGEASLWSGVAWDSALLAVAVCAWRAVAEAGEGAGVVLPSVLVAGIVVAGHLWHNAGLNRWHRSRSAGAPGAAPEPGSGAGLMARAVDRREMLLGLATVLLALGLLEAVVLAVPKVLPGTTAWSDWAVVQPALAVTAVSVVRIPALLTVARARGVLGDRRVWLLTASAGLTAGAAASLVLGAGPLVVACAAAVAMATQLVATLMPPTRPDRSSDDPQTAATVGSFAVLVVAVGVLATAAVGHTVADEALQVPPALTPFAGSAVVLCVLATALSATRLLLNLRHLTWSVALHRQALTDELTGLLNRRGLLRRLDAACAGGGPLGLALLDVDHFRSVNDGLGPAAGDELVRQVAARLQTADRTFTYQRSIARLGADEFVVLVLPEEIDVPDEVRADSSVKARQWGILLHQLFTEPFDLLGTPVHVSVSIGLTTLNPARDTPGVPASAWGSSIPQIADDDRRPEELLRRLDAAMYEAKADEQRGRSVIYDPRRHDDATRSLRTAEELRAAIPAGQLVVLYQPQIGATTGQVHGVEALVRWQHPTRGLLGPDVFLGVAETHGLMGQLTDVVLDTAIAQLAAWRALPAAAAVLRDLRMSVNLSASSLLDAELPDRVASCLDTYRVPAGQLVLEVTETVLLRDPERSTAVVAALRVLGVELSIDDFGTGYSSLTQLRTLPVQELKLDRAFTAGLAREPRAAHIVASTVTLAHGLGMRVVAEGVEDVDTLQQLIDLGCDTTQGYLHARPSPADEVEDLVRTMLPKAVLTSA